MSENTRLWDILGRTDPKHTKKFKRAGGFEGTAIKPMWSYRRMTEEFGPCGQGWGIGEPSFQIVPGDNREILVYCTASIWYGGSNERSVVYGVGGDKIVTHIKANDKYKTPERWQNDDEAFKKAFTDAVTNALKMIGVGADVHMGMFDDNKYVNTMLSEFSDEPAPAATKSSAQLKRDGFWTQFESEVDECNTLLMLQKVREYWHKRAKEDGWTKAWMYAAKDRIEGREAAILAAMPAEELAEIPLNEALTKSLAQHPLRAG